MHKTGTGGGAVKQRGHPDTWRRPRCFMHPDFRLPHQSVTEGYPFRGGLVRNDMAQEHKVVGIYV